MARAGQALKESEDNTVCMRSVQPAMPGQGVVVASMAQHEVVVGAAAARLWASMRQLCLRVLLQAAQAAAARAAAQDHAAALAQLQASVKDKEIELREALARQA